MIYPILLLISTVIFVAIPHLPDHYFNSLIVGFVWYVDLLLMVVLFTIVVYRILS
jgi:hypothetical protein